MPVTLPNTIVNGVTADGARLQENFAALRNHANTVEASVTAAVADHEADRTLDRAYTDSQATALANARVVTHEGSTANAHSAGAITFPPQSGIAATNVRDALIEVRADAVAEANYVNTTLITRIQALEAVAWTTLPLSSGWVNFPGRQAAQYRKIGDEVQLRGMIRSGTFTPGTVCAVLPNGWLPPGDDTYPASTGGGAGYLLVSVTGQVQVYDLVTNAGLSLSGIRFSVAG